MNYRYLWPIGGCVWLVGLALLLAALAGCASRPQEVRYEGPGNQSDLMNVHYQCLREVQNTSVGSGNGNGYSSVTAPACAAIVSCLAAKGYSANPNGALALSSDVRVPCI